MQMQSLDLIHTSTTDIWKLWDGNSNPIYQVSFDDHETVEMSAKHIIISRYLWEAFTEYPEVPVCSHHAFNGDRFGPTTHLGILEKILFDIRRHVHQNQPHADMDKVMEHLQQVAYRVTNDVFNDFSVKLAEYVSTTRLDHYVEIVEHPEVKPKLDALYAQLNPSPMQMEETYNHVKKCMERADLFPRNPIARAIRAGNTKPGSILQSIVARGTPTDIDSRIFPKTIKTGYLRGVNTLVDQIMDSRTSAKSLSYQSKPMQDSEYLNRKLQLSGATLMNIHQTDCGSKKYYPVTVKIGSLKDFVGKFFFDESIQKERAITEKDSYLQGRTLKMRTVFGCQINDPYGVCVHCLGELGYNIPKYTNLGHQFVINLQAPVGQLLLSDKHYVSTATGDGYALSSADRNFFTTQLGDENTILLNPQLTTNSLKFRLLAHEALGLNDVSLDIDVKDLNVFRISELSFIEISGESSLGQEFYHEFSSCTNAATRKLAFTQEALEFIQSHGYTTLDDGSYEIDFTHYDRTKPILILPRKQVSTVDYMKNIEKFVRGEGTKDMPSMCDYDSNIAAVQGFHEIVAERMSVHFSCLEVITLAHSVRDIEARDYRLPDDKSKAQIAKYNNLMNLRSLSAKMAYQGHVKIMFSESAFIIRNRPEHHLDTVLMGSYNYHATAQI